jgi:hypothetical protein
MAAAILLAGCKPEMPPAPGYKGPLPSDAAQAAVAALAGKTFVDTTGTLSPGPWVVGGTVVAGPHGLNLDLSQGSIRTNVPILCDGDAADMYRRVTGAIHPALAGPISAPFARFWAPKANR